MIKILKSYWPIVILFCLVIFGAFYPSLFFGKVPLNGNNLVSFFSPWIYQKWSGYPTGVPAKPGILDQLRIYYPYMRLTQESYRLGQLPLWNPYNFAGNPHMAEWQSGVFYPLHIFLPFLPLPVYWTLYQMMGFFLAGLFTYLYLRNLTINKLASIFGGLTYSFSTFMFTWNAEVIPTTHSILWLPAMLLLIDKFLVKPRWKYWLLLIGCGVASILSGYWQTTFYVLAMATIYILIRSYLIFPQGIKRKPTPKSIGLLFAAFILMAGFTAFHLLPTAELYSRSSRSLINLRADLQEVIKGYLLKPYWLITYLIPDFFGHPTTRNNFSYSNGTYYEWALFIGTLQILILPFIFFGSRLLRRLALTFILIGAAAGSLAFDLPYSRWIFDIKFPLLSTGIANRVLFIPAFCLSIISAISLHNWLEAKLDQRRKMTLITLLINSILFIGFWVFLWKIIPQMPYNNLRFPSNWFNVSRRNSVIPTAVFIFGSCMLVLGAWRRKTVTFLALLFVLVSTAQNLYQFHKFTPFSETRFIYPTHPVVKFLQENGGVNRYLGYNGVFLNYNFATQFKIFTIEGYDSLNDFRRSQLFYAAQKEGELATDLNRSADVTLESRLDNPYILRMIQLTGTKYFVDHPEFPDALDKNSKPTLPLTKQQLVFNDNDWKIYEYLDALPRAFLAGNYLVEPNDQAAVYKLFDSKFNPRQTIILNQAPIGINPEPDPQAAVTISQYTPNKITFRTSSKTDQLLFLSDTFYPGWKARVDNKPAPVLMADFAFRAVPVPTGNHQVEMYYLPNTFTTGLKIAGVTSVIMFILMKFLKV